MDTGLNVLVVEDHEDLREITVAALAAKGYRVRGADCAEALDEAMAAERAQLLVLDLNLPGEDGISIAHRLRKAHPEIGIVMLTARDTPRDVLAGYDSGADIYLTKPTSVEELGAAIRALSRRMIPSSQAGRALVLKPSVLQLKGPSGEVDVSNLESRILAALSRARDHRLETWQLLELAGKDVTEQEKRTLTVQIVRLRKKLAEAGAPGPTLKAIRGAGYQLCVELHVES